MTARPGTRIGHGLALAIVLWCVGAVPARAYHEPGSEWMFGSAYTLDMGEASLGIMRWQVGLLDELTLGTSVLPWVVGPFFGAVIPNGHVKIRDWIHGPVAGSLALEALYLNGSALLDDLTPGSGTDSALLSVTATAAGSARWNPQLTTSLELVYTSVGISGNNEALAFEGSAVLDSLRLVLLAQWNLSRVVALQLAGRVLLYREAPTFAVSYEIDPRTSVEAELHANFVPPIGAWNLVPTLALSGEYLNFKVGAGYGHRWLPVVGLVFSPGLVLDLDFFVRF